MLLVNLTEAPSPLSMNIVAYLGLIQLGRNILEVRDSIGICIELVALRLIKLSVYISTPISSFSLAPPNSTSRPLARTVICMLSAFPLRPFSLAS